MFLCVFKHFQPYALWILYTDTITKACTDGNEDLRIPEHRLQWIHCFDWIILKYKYENGTGKIYDRKDRFLFNLLKKKKIKKKWQTFQESDWMFWLAHCIMAATVYISSENKTQHKIFTLSFWYTLGEDEHKY